MSKCVLKKLKVTFDNPNLPILETMQQFTLDAITASGNSSMTDAQKWALNHFFYQVGAIDSNTLWGKIDVLLLPMVCGQVLEKALVNYKGNIVEGPLNSQYWSFSENGGLSGSAGYYGTLTTKYVGSSASLSAVVATMADYIPSTASLWRIGNSSSILNNYCIKHTSLGNKYIGNCRSAAFDMTSEDLTLDIGGMRVLPDKNIFKLVSSAGGGVLTGTDSTLSGVKEAVTFTSDTGRIQLDGNVADYGAAILSGELTEAEMDTVLNALKVLKVAFKPVI